MYGTFGPRQLVAAMDQAKGLMTPTTRSFGGLHAAVAIKFGFVMVGIAAALILLILPLRNKAMDAGDALCGGNLDFVHSVNEVQHAMHHGQRRCHMHGHIYADWYSLMDWNRTGAAKSTAGHESS